MTTQMNEASTFIAKRKRLSAEHVIDFQVDKVFPLLCPVREFDWIEAWDCKIIYSQSGLAELGCVFTTENPADGGLDTWVISRYQKNKHIQFVRINPWRSIQYDLTITENNNKTNITWSQTITALNEAGNQWIESVKAENFNQQIKQLETLLNFYLTHGKAMKVSE